MSVFRQGSLSSLPNLKCFTAFLFPQLLAITNSCIIHAPCRFAEEGKPNFDLLKAPPPDMLGGFCASVHPVGDEWEEEQVAEKRKEKLKWREKVIVDDIHFHTHR